MDKGKKDNECRIEQDRYIIIIIITTYYSRPFLRKPVKTTGLIKPPAEPARQGYYSKIGRQGR